MTEYKVVDVEFSNEIVDIGAEAAKKLPPGYRFRYKVPSKYTSENGVVVDSQETAMSIPKLRQKIKDKVDFVRRGCVKVSQISGEWYVFLTIGRG